MRSPPKIGDAVQIKKATHDGAIWLDATVIFSDASQIVVSTSGGMNEAVPHGQSRYREKPKEAGQ